MSMLAGRTRKSVGRGRGRWFPLALSLAVAVTAAAIGPPAAGAGVVGSGVTRVAPEAIGLYVPAFPCRVLDTRTSGAPLVPGLSRHVAVTGHCDVPAGAIAAELSVSAVNPTGTGYLRAWAAFAPQPGSTFLNYRAGVSITNTGTIPLSSEGHLQVEVFANPTHVTIDVLGYYLPSSQSVLPANAAVYVPVTPCRIVDTRVAGGALGAGGSRLWQVSGASGFAAQGGLSTCGIPTNALAVEMSVSAVNPAGSGYLRLWPEGGAEPNATFLNYRKSASITNTGTLPLPPIGGRLRVKNYATSTHVVIDVQGYFLAKTVLPLPSGASAYVASGPCRIVDTRVAGGALASGTQRTWAVTGATGFAAQGGRSDCGIPAGAKGVEMSVSAVNPAGSGYLRFWQTGAPVPNATFLNFQAGASITNTGAVPLSVGGTVDVRGYQATTHVVVDVQGYFLGWPVT